MVNFTINPESLQPSILDPVYKTPVKLYCTDYHSSVHTIPRVLSIGIFESKQKERLAKEEQLSQLRANLTSKKPVEMKSMYYVSLPTESAHHKTHPTRGSNIMTQKVNPNIVKKISELVSEGMVDPYEVHKALKHYVNEVMCVKIAKPDFDHWVYYPIIRDIQNHIYKAKQALDLSKFDQENLKLKIKSWEKEEQSKLYFRPFIKSEGDNNDGRATIFIMGPSN